MREDCERLVVLSGLFRNLTDDRQDRLLKTAKRLLSAQKTAKEAGVASQWQVRVQRSAFEPVLDR